VVAAGWAVDDTAANAFADKFYSSMLDGSSFGEAVTAARKAANEAAGEDNNTWAAYQCYGDPAYRLNGVDSTPGGKFYLSPREVLCDLWAIRDKKHNDFGELLNSDMLRQELEQIARLIPHEWMGNGDVRNALGLAYGTLGNFDSAIEHYEAAAICNDGACSLRAIEQLFNIRVRKAEKSYCPVKKNGAETIKEIEKLIKDFDRLIGLVGRSKERCCLMGSAYKRLVQIKKSVGIDPLTDKTLNLMVEWYHRGVQIDSSDPYPALNWAMGMIAIHGSGQKVNLKNLKATVTQVGQNGRMMNERNPEFWAGIHALDAELFLLLLDELDDAERNAKANEIIRQYLEQFALYGNSNFIDSVKSQFDFYLMFVTDESIRAILNQVKEGLSEI